ncbi:MAG: E3 binding domain-containing protein, partial [SAR324 cluster bacterium]|nr:E3 binding domain-containing protein [SAR324 cluster bacterium]
MANLLTMPSLSPTMETGVISAWRKQEGEFIEVGEVLAEIETDKAVMDYEMADEGYVRALLVDEGQEVAVGMPIAILSESEDEDISQLRAQAASATPPPAEAAPAAPPEPPAPAPEASAAGLATAAQAPASPAPVAAPPAAPRAEPVPTGANGGRVKIAPYGKKLAEQNQIDWRALVGSGPGGRIV